MVTTIAYGKLSLFLIFHQEIRQSLRARRYSRGLKTRASRRDPALCGYCKCSHIIEYAALSKTPHALVDGLMLVFQHPASLRDICGFQPLQSTRRGAAGRIASQSKDTSSKPVYYVA